MPSTSEDTTPESRILHRSFVSVPLTAARAEGVFIYLEDGTEILDGSGGAAVACLGHGNKEVIESMFKQMRESFCYVHSSTFTSRVAEDLAQTLLEGSPGGLERAYFCSSGSEAVEAALKLATQYHVIRGDTKRDMFMSRNLSYHGNTLGALSVGGHRERRRPYTNIIKNNCVHLPECYAYRNKALSETDDEYLKVLEKQYSEAFAEYGHRTIAFFAETIVGATAGVLLPVRGYFEMVRRLCDKYGVLLVLDEVMCGIGRCGSLFAWQNENVHPDIQTCAKGLAGGYQPLSAILVGKKVFNEFRERNIAFMHGHTYQAHPVACAAGLAVVRTVRRPETLANVQSMGKLLGSLLQQTVAKFSYVGDIRGRGLFWGIEFVQDKSTKKPFSRNINFSGRLSALCLQNKLALYPGQGTADGIDGDHIIIAPPYTITAAQIHMLVDRLVGALQQLESELS